MIWKAPVDEAYIAVREVGHRRFQEPMTYDPPSESISTGLLDSSGDEIYRARRRRPIGFLSADDLALGRRRG